MTSGIESAPYNNTIVLSIKIPLYISIFKTGSRAIFELMYSYY